MQRKIKFKFYDKKSKRLKDVISINWEQGIVVCVFDRKGYVSLLEDGDLLQYTDRKDKYKKEIFEGHIISEQDHLGGKPPMEVYWDESLSGFRCRHGVYQGPLPGSKNIEIIGNIYENSELLKTVYDWIIMNVGYARVSTADQTLNLQLDALKKVECSKIFTDTASGTKTERTGLEEALN